MKRNSGTTSGCNGIAPDRQRELECGASETCVPHTLQHIPRFSDGLPGRIDHRIRTLDAPAHLDDVNEAVVQDVVDVVGQTLNGRAAHIFEAHSTTRTLRAHDATTKPKSQPHGNPTRPFIRLPTQQERRSPRETPLLRRLTPHARGFMTVKRPPITNEVRKPAWRRACLAYREMREAGASDQEAHDAAVAAVQQVLPLLSRKEASAEAVNAIRCQIGGGSDAGRVTHSPNRSLRALQSLA